MDSTRSMIFTKIQNLEPEHAIKIMGFILIQDPDEKEMFRLAFGPEFLLKSIILQAKSYLGISSNTFSTSSSSTSKYFNHVTKHNLNFVPVASPSSLSYVASGLNNSLSSSGDTGGGSSSSGGCSNGVSKIEDLFHTSFEMLMINGKNNLNTFHHKRSVSLNDTCYGGGGFEDSGCGFTPSMHYSKGLCKNGGTDGFKHGGFVKSCDDVYATIRSPSSKFDAFIQIQDNLWSQGVTASQLMSEGLYRFNPRSNRPFPMLVGEEFNKFGRSKYERSNISSMRLDMMDPNARQIYLTFPADCTFSEDDVFEYVSIFGPVQDVRIPYQHKRMFGFVTFIYSETVKLILAKGNPHFVCDSRVLVKPYKEKAKVNNYRKRYQQYQPDFERGEISSTREPFEILIGPRIYCNTKELMLRRKAENQVNLQQGIELEGERIMNLQHKDIKNHHYLQNLLTFDHNPIPIPIPIPMCTYMNQNLIPSDDTTPRPDISKVNNNTFVDRSTNVPNNEKKKIRFSC